VWWCIFEYSLKQYLFGETHHGQNHGNENIFFLTKNSKFKKDKKKFRSSPHLDLLLSSSTICCSIDYSSYYACNNQKSDGHSAMMLETAMTRGSSTFAVARQVIEWATDIEPTLCIQEDDVLPLCVGPMRKVLNFSESIFRNSIDVKNAVTNLGASNEKLIAAERKKKNNEMKSIRLKIRRSQETEKKIRIDLISAISQLLYAEAKNDRILLDRDALNTGWKIHEEINLKRSNEVCSWTRMLDICRDLSKIESTSLTIGELRNRSANALTSSKTDSSEQLSTLKLQNVQTTTDRYSASLERTPNRQTNADLHCAIIADYAAAARVSHFAAEKYKDRIIFDVEDDVLFRNALSLELASAEKSALKRCISQVF
jgi:hypothetical protein